MWQKGLTLAGVWLVLNIVCAVVDLPHGAVQGASVGVAAATICTTSGAASRGICSRATASGADQIEIQRFVAFLTAGMRSGLMFPPCNGCLG
ncbi:hypothetical protein PP577_11910 [Mycobacteroides abscessus]|nr:hypothetical protein [Mycobacteroides abscessus]MDM2424679.1 hypothetical protein [Mycobacteroides abscessus]MDM2430493.1 hypothetical protein [Mycobacteroides abscessus]MDM2435246.1 hypothetical protein [Mycobacteroides abscessus]MDM2443028.1 hypothetical protein [Mycobacteroides abscessus]